jgi:hypothetical protein
MLGGCSPVNVQVIAVAVVKPGLAGGLKRWLAINPVGVEKVRQQRGLSACEHGHRKVFFSRLG